MVAEFNYLESITEDLIYETYREAIVCDHKRSYANFMQEHRDAYLRLKMRGMRPVSFPSPVSIPQHFTTNTEEDKK